MFHRSAELRINNIHHQNHFIMLDINSQDKFPKCGWHSSSTGTDSFHRPLGKPAGDMSMYYDKNFNFPPTKSKSACSSRRAKAGKEARQRPATTIPCIKQQRPRDDGDLTRRSWPNIGRVKDGWHALVSNPPSNQEQRPLVSLPTHTVSDQRYKLGEIDRPHSHDLSTTLPPFNHAHKGLHSHQVPSRPQSEQTMCKLPSMRKVAANSVRHQQGDELQWASNGLSVRHSTYRSLANNPKLKVKAKEGKLQITRRRPKSLPASLQQEMQLAANRAEKETPKKEFYHRSKSPTLATLSKAKEQLDVALSKKLWHIRMQVDGQRDRENSAVYSHISSAKTISSSEDWYERMLREHSDEDLAAIETLCIANHEDQLKSSESLSLMATRPKLDIHFDSEYLRMHVNDWDILALMADEERKRRERELRKAKQEAGRPKAATSTLRKPRKIAVQLNKPQRKQPNPVLPPKVEPVININVPISLPPVIDNVLSETKENEISEELSHSTVDNSDESNAQDTEKPQEDLISKYLLNSKSTVEPIQEQYEQIIVEDNKEVNDNQDDSASKRSDGSTAKKELTEKEKFLVMRKRMEERKADKDKRRERFNEYSLGNKTNNKSLGSLMSSRLEKIATFKSSRRRSSDDDDDDYDGDYGIDDDDDDDDDEED